MAAPVPMTVTSAAAQLASWVAGHGRLPTDQECVPANGLPHWKTIYLRFPGPRFSARLSAILAGGLPSSAGHGIAVSMCPGSQRLLPCLICEVPFSVDPACRTCPVCKKLKRQRPDAVITLDEEPILTQAQMRRYGIGQADWDMEVW